MKEQEARELLEDAFNQMTPGASMARAQQKYAKLKMHTAHRQVNCADNLYQKARSVMTGKAAFIAAEPARRLVLLTGSGFNQRNPAVVELTFTDSSVTVEAWAKEGFIPQKSAAGAVDAMLEALGLS